MLRSIFGKVLIWFSSYLNKRRGTVCSKCKYCNGYSCMAGLEWYSKCCGLTNKGFVAR